MFRLSMLGAVLLGTTLLTGCATGPGIHANDYQASGSYRALDSWVETDLAPYIADQLAINPKFRGQPFLIVAMDGDEIRTDIDELTQLVREQVMDRLLATQGVNLSWRPAVRPWRHHQTLDEVQCADYQHYQFYIGLDIDISDVDGELSVKTRALNLDENRWESGFIRSWRGRASDSQRDAMARVHTDEHLRGLRPLPFDAKQPDLLASYLAQNMSCLLRHGEVSDIQLYRERPEIAQTGYFNTTLDLVDNYISRFREVQLTQDPQAANVTVRTEVHHIHGDMYQVWLSARDLNTGRTLTGAETAAYTNVSHETSPAVSMPVVSAPVDYPGGNIIDQFRVITPMSQSFCGTDTPWLIGERTLQYDEHISSNGCFALDMTVNKPAEVFLVGADGYGSLTALLPSQCSALRHIGNRLSPHQTLLFPQESGALETLELDGNPGVETIYAIAVNDQHLANRLHQELRMMDQLCDEGVSKTMYTRPASSHGGWPQTIEHLEQQYPNQVDVRVFRFWHEG